MHACVHLSSCLSGIRVQSCCYPDLPTGTSAAASIALRWEKPPRSNSASVSAPGAWEGRIHTAEIPVHMAAPSRRLFLTALSEAQGAAYADNKIRSIDDVSLKTGEIQKHEHLFIWRK